MTIKIGDTLYCKRDYGRSEWKSDVITGETKQSWLIGDGWSQSKINKKTMLENLKQYGSKRWYTEADMHDKDWRDRNINRLSQLVQAQDTAMLKQIAELIGYPTA